MFSILSRRFTFQHRLIAVLGVALMLVISALAVQPDLHEALCHHRTATAQHPMAGDSEDFGCIVSQFSHGQLLAALVLLVCLIGPAYRSTFIARERELAFVSARYHLPPGRGPPAV